LKIPALHIFTRHRADISACVLLLVLAFTFMLPGIVPGKVAAPMDVVMVYPPWRSHFPDVRSATLAADVPRQQLPWHHWIRDELQAGRFPLWASDPIGGYPLFASMQPAVLYPLHLIWALFMPVGTGFGVILALKLWLAGVGMWGMLRAFGLHPLAALFGAVSFMFSAYLVNWLSWTHTSVHLLLPWMAWAVYEWWVHRRRGALVGLAVLISFAIFGGHPETLFLLGVTLGLWLIGLLAVNRKSWLLGMAGLAAATALGFGLGAVQLLPFLEAVSLSHETARRAVLWANNPMVHLRLEQLIDWVMPRFWSYSPDKALSECCSQYDISYIGFILMAGIGLVVVAGIQRRLPWRLVVPWLLPLVIAWIVTYDDVLGTFIRSLPIFSINANVRWISIISFIGIVLGSIGWNSFMRSLQNQSPPPSDRFVGVWAALGATLLILGVVAACAHALGLIPAPVLTQRAASPPWWLPNVDYRIYWSIWYIGLASAVLGVVLLLASRRTFRLPPSAAPVLLVFLLVADLWRTTMPLIGTAPADQYYPPTRYVTDVSQIVPPYERILVQDDVLPTNSALVLGIRDWRTQDPLLSERAYRAATLLDPDLPSRPFDDYNMVLRHVNLQLGPMFGMRFFASDNPGLGGGQDPLDPGKPEIKRLLFKEEVGLWEVSGVPGFAYLSSNVTAVPDEMAAADWLRSLTWQDVRAFPAVVEIPNSMISALGSDHAPGPAGSVTVRDYRPGHFDLQVDAARPALLVVAESYYPGWEASVDGVAAQILRTNYISQGILVPGGCHTIKLNYAPSPFRYGLAVSLVSLLGVLALALWSWRGSRKIRHPL
jgi:hypothetical protein